MNEPRKGLFNIEGNMKLLFICSRNKLRSPTAEVVFNEYPGLTCSSAGLAPDAEHVVALDDIEWADVIFVMEKAHVKKLKTKFGKALEGTRVVCLGIPDEYDFMDPALVAELKSRVPQFI
jgi:predicted protein tyrosine phosphatase